MDQQKKKAWEELKTAVDKYNDITGADVGVVASRLSEVEYFSQSLVCSRSEKNMIQMHGHGSLFDLLRKFVKQHHQDTAIFNMNQEEINLQYSTTFAPKPLTSVTPRKDVKMGFHIPHSLPSTFTTMKTNPSSLNNSPNPINMNRSRLGKLIENGNTINMNSKTATDADEVRKVSFDTSNEMNEPKISKRKKNLGDDDIELDEFVAFGDEPRVEKSRNSDDGNRATSDDEELFSLSSRRERQQEKVQSPIVGSLPVNIVYPNNRRHFNTDSPPQNHGRRRPRVDEAEANPSMENMMSQMQLLSQSVNADSSSLIFGERPRRPRMNSMRTFLYH